MRGFVGAGALVACRAEGEVPRDEASRAIEAHEALRRFGEGWFEVQSFTPGVSKAHEYRDDFGFVTAVVAQSFSARVRVVAPFEVPSKNEMMVRSRRPGWQPEQIDREFQLFSLLGEGEQPAGRVVEVQGAAVFDRLRPGERFRAFDRVR